MDKLCCLLYVSRASLGVDEGDFLEILAQSRANNPAERISGLLRAGGGQFVQVLEGPQKNVLQLYTRILEDPRHYDSVLIGVNYLPGRLFSEWAMGYITNPPEVMEARRKTLLEEWESHSKRTEFVQLMRGFVAQLRTQPAG
ncbi:MAG: BLUF domain-containing protein [Pseudohaliea sp.]